VPGGHIDEGESPSDAAVREVYEELGVKVHTPIFLKFHELFSPDYKNVGALFHCHNFAVIMKPDQEIKLNEEYDDYIFVSPDKALEKEDLHPSARMIIEYYLEYKNINNT
jgi:8-oxo-dGTP pyrophosphatase MutT (NUDIX family)